MKKITIYQKNSEKIEIFDNNDMSIDDACKELSFLFQGSNVTILHTTSKSIIVRPSDITGIEVEDVVDESPVESEQPEEEPVKEEVKVQEDIITDMD